MSTVPSRHLPDLQKDESLETFIDRHLRPPKEFKSLMSKAVDTVVTHLHQMSSIYIYNHYSINQIVKSGSLGKGTSYGETADVDLVVFFNGYEDMNSFLEDKPRILQDIKVYMCYIDLEWWSWFRFFGCSRPEWVQKIHVVKDSPYHVEFEAQINYNGKLVTVNWNILPTIDVIEIHRSRFSDVYNEMETQTPDVREHYSVCFCKHQNLLYNGRMAKVKDLIRLLKYWRTENGFKTKLSSYCCEVLALWVYRNRLNEDRYFKMSAGFKEVLEILANLEGEQVVPSDGGTSEYLECFNDPANPYSTTIPYRGGQEMRNCANSTLRSIDNVTEDALCTIQ